MIDRTDKFEFVGFWKRVGAQLLDLLILSPLVLPVGFFLSSWAFTHRSVTLSVLWALCWTGLWVLPVIFFGGTPGKLLIGIRIVDSEGRFLSWTRALRRELFPIILLQLVGIIVVWKTILLMPEGVSHLTALERGELIYAYGQPYAMLADILNFAILVDIGVILFNRRKRAIHDFVAGSYVITKASYTELAKCPDDGEGIAPADLSPERATP